MFTPIEKKSMSDRLRSAFPYSPTTYATALSIGAVIGLTIVTRQHTQTIDSMLKTIDSLTAVAE